MIIQEKIEATKKKNDLKMERKIKKIGKAPMERSEKPKLDKEEVIVEIDPIT